MSEAGVFPLNFLLFLIDLATLVLIGGVFYVIGLAVITMARNQKPNWESILYTVLILLSAIWLIRWYPRQVIVSIRVALEESRPEAQLLREELRLWLPGTDLIIATPGLPPMTPAPVEMVLPMPAATMPESSLDMLTQPTPPPVVMPSPYPTYTPWPTVPAPPTPTPCLIYVDGHLYQCPPTPGGP